jgi:hypothetical protein
VSEIVGLAVALVYIWCSVQIARKAGYSAWWVLLTLLPFVNLVVMLKFATADWPVRQALREAQRYLDPPVSH